MVEYGNMAKETEKTVGTSYGVTLAYRTEETNRYKSSNMWWPNHDTRGGGKKVARPG